MFVHLLLFVHCKGGCILRSVKANKIFYNFASFTFSLACSNVLTVEDNVSGGTDYVVATTNLLSGDRLIDLITHKMEAVSLNPF